MKYPTVKSFLFIALIFFSCKTEPDFDPSLLEDPELFHSAMSHLTDVSVHDIFSPPVAARVYLYPSVAAYQVMANDQPRLYWSLVGQIKGLTKFTTTEKETVNSHIAALLAFVKVGKELIFSRKKMLDYEKKLMKSFMDMGVPKKMITASNLYASQVADHVLNWAANDMYHQTRTYPKYTIREKPRFWKPTPPDYMDGIEPHWNKIRTMVLDSSRQFSPKPPLEFDLKTGSPFQKQLYEVYEVGNRLTEEQIEIAKFWDCNPYVSHHRGHVMFATKKITPGGHWMGITAIASRNAKLNFEETINAYTNVAIGLFDAFISCWDEKWKTLVVRPETLINEYYDQDWTPLLQTPPFPEYTSGHSVISTAAAVILTDLFGENFHFNDTTELKYNLPARKFDSFIEASQEAAISRLYGGIHYMMAIDEGVAQGQKVGAHIVEKVQTKILNPKGQ